MTTVPKHRCKVPDAKRYAAGVVFQCNACGAVHVLVARWECKTMVTSEPRREP